MRTCATLLIAAMLGCSSPSAAPVQPRPASWTVVRPAEWQPDRWGAALCNDGTAASMALDRGTGKRWVIRISGGYYCDEGELMCRDRARVLTTALSTGTAPIPQGGAWNGPHEGLFSRALANPLAEANQADLKYCSSDVWLGESEERQPIAGNKRGWYFSGRKILRAELEALRELGMDPADPEVQIVLVGQSAGAIGLGANLDLVREVLPEAVAAGRVAAIFDGGWIPEVPLQDSFRLNHWGSWQAECEARLKAEGGDVGRCLFGPNWWVDWKDSGIPALMVQSGVDSSQVKALKIQDVAGARTLRDATRSSLEPVPRVVSGGWSYHVITFDPRLDDTPFGALVLEEVKRLVDRGEPKQVFYRYEDSP